MVDFVINSGDIYFFLNLALDPKEDCDLLELITYAIMELNGGFSFNIMKLMHQKHLDFQNLLILSTLC